jgi:hypothetical protein
MAHNQYTITRSPASFNQRLWGLISCCDPKFQTRLPAKLKGGSQVRPSPQVLEGRARAFEAQGHWGSANQSCSALEVFARWI